MYILLRERGRCRNGMAHLGYNKQTNTTNGICFGGNVVNDGDIFIGSNTVYLASAYNTTTFSAVATSLPQTISGTGSFYNNLNSALATGSISSLTVNNTGSANGLTSQRVEAKPVATTLTAEQIEKRKSKFWDRFKNNLIEIFSEEDDKLLP